MTIDELIQNTFGPIYGKPCWQASAGHVGFLRFDFGMPLLKIGDVRQRTYFLSSRERGKTARRDFYVQGEWHLWVYCCDWAISLNGKRIARSESADKRIDRTVGLLDGQILTNVSIDPRNGRSVFEFYLGGILSTWPYDNNSEQWMLFEPSRYVLTVRADGWYHHDLGNTLPDQEHWQPLPPHK